MQLCGLPTGRPHLHVLHMNLHGLEVSGLLWSDSSLPCGPCVTSMKLSDTQVSSLSSEETLRALDVGLTDMTKGLWGQRWV